MAKVRTDATAECLVCHTVIGTIFAVEEATRPGFWSQYSEPAQIPKTCPSCHEPLTRVEPV